MLKLVQIWSKATGAGPVSLPYDPAGVLLTDADLKDDDFDVNDPDIPEFLREHKKERQREQEANLEFERRQSAAEKKQHDKEEKEHRMHDWLASEQYRRALQQLGYDIADARQATQSAYDRARKEEGRARQVLEEARRNALVVSGNRVYFTRDGSRLYGEEGNEITDHATVEDARRQRRERPDATSYDDFIARRDSWDQTAQKADQLKNTLGRLDDLDKRIKDGDLSPEDLARARKDTRDIIDSLPSDAREEYDRRQAVREHPEADYRSAASLYAGDGSPARAPDASKQFEHAAAPRTAASAQNSQTGPTPASPDTDDYRPGF